GRAVEERILPVIGPMEEIIRVIEPAAEEIGNEGELLALKGAPPLRARDLVERHPDADLGETLLEKDAERLLRHRRAHVEGKRRLEAVGMSCLGEKLFRLGEI